MIRELRLLPPLAVARLGSSPAPMDNYDVKVRPADPLAFREIAAAPTFTVDRATGRITGAATPAAVRFKDANGRVKPLAPFLELWCDNGDGVLRPLTTAILTDEGLSAASVRWQVKAANLKAFRRTREPADRILADTGSFTDHQTHTLVGMCANFVPGKNIPFGDVQYIQPTAQFPEIRLRFTPGRGLVYGCRKRPNDPDTQDIVYKANGPWATFRNDDDRNDTVPGSIYAGGGEGLSRGYLDDACDGIVEAQLTVGGNTLRAIARVASGPPDYAPDSFPVRTVADELEQALLGPTIDVADTSPRIVEEIVRRAFETVRLQNTTGINGNEVAPGQIISNMAAHDNGGGRAYEPIMAPALVDNLALRSLHQSIYAALSSGTAEWFSQVLRDYDQVADLTNAGRRKMPAMMRNADGYHLALTRRQVDAIR